VLPPKSGGTARPAVLRPAASLYAYPVLPQKSGGIKRPAVQRGLAVHTLKPAHSSSGTTAAKPYTIAAHVTTFWKSYRLRARSHSERYRGQRVQGVSARVHDSPRYVTTFRKSHRLRARSRGERYKVRKTSGQEHNCHAEHRPLEAVQRLRAGSHSERYGGSRGGYEVRATQGAEHEELEGARMRSGGIGNYH
jgi:hypothetical protein